MDNRKIGLVVIVLTGFFCVSGANNSPKSVSSGKVSYENREFHKQYINPDSSGLSVDKCYPAITSAPTITAKNAINQYIKEALLNDADIGKRAKSFDDLFSSYLRDFSEERKRWTQEGEGPITTYWEYRDSVWIASDSQSILSVAFDHFSFTNGMRPDYGRNYANFDTHFGSQVYLKDILKGGYENKLEKIVSNHFEQLEKEIWKDDSVEGSSSRGEDISIALSENYSIGTQGITFYYNHGEIEAEAIGPIVLMIKYDEINDLIDEKGLLKRPSR